MWPYKPGKSVIKSKRTIPLVPQKFIVPVGKPWKGCPSNDSGFFGIILKANAKLALFICIANKEKKLIDID